MSKTLYAPGFHKMRLRRALRAMRIRSELSGRNLDSSMISSLPKFKSRHDKLEISDAIFDLHGTICSSGVLLGGVAAAFEALGDQKIHVHVLTGDADGKAVSICKDLGIRPHIIRGDDPSAKKAAYVSKYLKDFAYFGNGGSDFEAASLAGLAVCVIGGEGASRLMLDIADFVFHDIVSAIQVLLDERVFRSGAQV